MTCVHEYIIPFFGIIGLISCVGNLMIIWTYIRKESLHEKCHALLVNLSASDLLMATTLFPLALAAYLVDASICSRIQFAVELIEYTAFTSTICNIILSNIDRYLACCHYFLYNSTVSKYTVYAMITSWVMPALVSGLCLLNAPTERETPFIRKRLSTGILYVTATLSGLAIILFCQFKLYKKSKSYMDSMALQSARLQGQRMVSNVLHRQQKKRALVVTAVTVSFCFCYLPMTAAKICHLVGHSSKALVVYERVVAPMIMLNGALNPFVYGLSSSVFRQALVQEVWRKIPCIPRRVMPMNDRPTLSRRNVPVVDQMQLAAMNSDRIMVVSSNEVTQN